MTDRALDILVSLFEQVGLQPNTTKTEAMICTPGKIRTRLSTLSYYQSYQGYITASDWLNRKVECDKCILEMTARRLPKHIECKHGVYCSEVVEEEYLTPPPGGGTRYRASKQADGKSFD